MLPAIVIFTCGQIRQGGARMNTGKKELRSILEELAALKLPHMAAELQKRYSQPFLKQDGWNSSAPLSMRNMRQPCRPVMPPV